MKDKGQEIADKQLFDMELVIRREYAIAKKEMTAKLEKQLKSFEALDAKKKKQVENKTITQEAYEGWKKSQLLRSKWMRGMIKSYADFETTTNKKAASIINEFLPDVFAEAHNYGLFQIDSGTNASIRFDLHNKDTVKQLAKAEKGLLPEAKIDIPKDKRWNQQKMRSALTQGVLQGESISKISKRLSDITDMNRRAAIRNARTMATGAQSAGTLESLYTARDAGVPLVKMWQATFDDRTRSSHRHLHGETRELEEDFSNGLQYPADPNGAPKEVYNCRCRLSSQIKGFERDVTDLSNMNNKLGDMSYEEWKTEHNTPKHGAGESGNGTESNDLSPIERGAAMTWDKADAGSVNPNYGQEGTRTNCQTCVPVFVARLQGYDIEALPYTENAKALAKNVSSAYVDAERLLAPRLYDLLDGTNAEKFERMFALTDEGAVLQVAFDWAGADEGHTVIMSTDEEGMFIYDPQDDSYAFEDEFEMYFSKSRVDAQSIEVYRVDNAEINWDVLRPLARRRIK